MNRPTPREPSRILDVKTLGIAAPRKIQLNIATSNVTPTTTFNSKKRSIEDRR